MHPGGKYLKDFAVKAAGVILTMGLPLATVLGEITLQDLAVHPLAMVQPLQDLVAHPITMVQGKITLQVLDVQPLAILVHITEKSEEMKTQEEESAWNPLLTSHQI
ncbi:hypothetical protein APTSU1_000194900 [Apodemus speciosus]|uniref:Uncharacterized protein n=1 Tax=Apodemus speciosus TaxID=105296 RepID=A0ABQ0EI94_APOSI